jgi:tetratricopeptide (TPR) repeat protein
VPGYEVLAEVGRGGMGVVYKARHLALNRVVALKMILAGGHAGAADLARFRAEAQASARLLHPGIVQVFEVGEHEGRPFLSLEFCGGGTMAERLAGVPLPAAEAAALAEKLAQAVEAAHLVGVVHRDLKPANVLLSAPACGFALAGHDAANAKPQARLAGAVPKIADFGLARRLDQASQTQTGVVMGTPSYMAPEQAAGRKDVGPAADVYALGAILYECLTGRPPFRAPTAFDTIVQVLNDDPVPPRRLQPGVPRDLETICLKCLHKEPFRRYASAQELADDLARFRAGEPVWACPVSAVERGVKWVRRRPALAALAGVTLLAVVALFVVGFAFNLRLQRERDYALAQRDETERAREEVERQRNQARANFRLARQAVDEYGKKAAEDPRLKERGVQEVRKEWLQAAEKFYQEFIRQAGDDPEVRLDQARAYSRLAAISAEISTRAEAQKQYHKAQALWQTLLRDFPNRPECRKEMADVIAGLGDLEKVANRFEKAEQLLKEALAMRAALARDFPDNSTYRALEAASHNNLGLLYKDTPGQQARAERAFLTALELVGRIPRRSLDDREMDVLVAMSHVNLGGLYQNQEKFALAEESFRQGRLAFEKRQKGGGLTSEHRKMLALLHLTRAFLYHKTARPAQAEKAYLDALALLEVLADEQPHVTDLQNMLATNYMTLGWQYYDLGEGTKAATYYDRASRIQERLYRNHPDVRLYRTNRLSGLQALAMLHYSTGNATACDKVLHKALAAAQELSAAHPDDPEMKRKEGSIHVHLSKHYAALDDRPRALAEMRKDQVIREHLARKYPQRSEYVIDLAVCCGNLAGFVGGGQPVVARQLYDRAVGVLEGVLHKEPCNERGLDVLRNVLSGRAGLVEGQRPAEALADRLRARACLELMVCAHPDKAAHRRELAGVCGQLAALYRGQGRPDEAEAAYRKAFNVLDDLVRHGSSGDNDPVQSQTDLARVAANLANFLRYDVKGRALEAEPFYRRAIVVYGWLALTTPDTAGHLVWMGGQSCNLGHLLSRMTERPEQALPWYARAEWALGQALVLDPKNATARRFLRNTHSGRVGTRMALKQTTLAIKDQERVVKLQDEILQHGGTPQDRLEMAQGLLLLGLLYNNAGKPDRSVQLRDQAAVHLENLLGDSKLGPAAREALLELCRQRGLRGEHAGTAAEARRLLEGKPSAGQCAQGARIFALTVVAVNQDGRIPLSVRDKLAEDHARQALALLERARQAGHFATPARRQSLDRDVDLAVLRSRDDYRAWRSKLDPTRPPVVAEEGPP